MDSPGPDEIATALAEVDRRIGSINAALRAMPDGRRNTRYHIDRVNERRRLMEQRQCLVDRKAELASSN